MGIRKSSREPANLDITLWADARCKTGNTTHSMTYHKPIMAEAGCFQLSRYLMANEQFDVSTAQCSQYLGSPVGAAEPESAEMILFQDCTNCSLIQLGKYLFSRPISVPYFESLGRLCFKSLNGSGDSKTTLKQHNSLETCLRLERLGIIQLAMVSRAASESGIIDRDSLPCGSG